MIASGPIFLSRILSPGFVLPQPQTFTHSPTSNRSVSAGSGLFALLGSAPVHDVIILDIKSICPFSAGSPHERNPTIAAGRSHCLFHHEGRRQFLSEANKAGVQGFVTKDRASAALISGANSFLCNDTFFPWGAYGRPASLTRATISFFLESFA
jgi:hypothetical protein